MIDFRFTEEQDMLRTAAREFAEEVIAPLVPQMRKPTRCRKKSSVVWVSAISRP